MEKSTRSQLFLHQTHQVTSFYRCLRLKLAIPQYELVEEKGQPNEKNFVLSCRVGAGLETRGEGRNKKIAKRNAAIEMLKIIESIPSDATQLESVDDALGSVSGCECVFGTRLSRPRTS